MPNKDNILKPITLVGFYRSGTTLMSHIFSRHNQIAVLYETSNIIHGIWNALETDPLADLNHKLQFLHGLNESNEDFKGRLIRNLFLDAYPDQKPYWFHKPIGIPQTILKNYGASDWEKAASWYWLVFKNVFPSSKYFTILRHPLDMVISARSRFGWSEEITWHRLALICYFLDYFDAPIIHPISYTALVNDPRNTLVSLFDYLEIEFQDHVLEALQIIDNPSVGREKISPNFCTREVEWQSLQYREIPISILSPIMTFFNKHDPFFRLPNFIVGSEGSQTDVDFTVQNIVPLQSTIDKIHQDWSLRMSRHISNSTYRIKELETQLEALKKTTSHHE